MPGADKLPAAHQENNGFFIDRAPSMIKEARFSLSLSATIDAATMTASKLSSLANTSRHLRKSSGSLISWAVRSNGLLTDVKAGTTWASRCAVSGAGSGTAILLWISLSVKITPPPPVLVSIPTRFPLGNRLFSNADAVRYRSSRSSTLMMPFCLKIAS